MFVVRYVNSSFSIIWMGKRKLVALLGLSSWCLVMVVWLFLVVPWVCLRFMIVVFPDNTVFFNNYFEFINLLVVCLHWYFTSQSTQF